MAVKDMDAARKRAIKAFDDLSKGITLKGLVRLRFGANSSRVEEPVMVYDDRTHTGQEVEEYRDNYTLLERGQGFKPSLFPGDHRTLLATLGDQIVLGGRVPPDATKSGSVYTWRTWTGAYQQFRVVRSSTTDYEGSLYYLVSGEYRLAASYKAHGLGLAGRIRLPTVVQVTRFRKNGKPSTSETYTLRVVPTEPSGVSAIPTGEIVVDNRLGLGKELSYRWVGHPKELSYLRTTTDALHAYPGRSDARQGLLVASGGSLFFIGLWRSTRSRAGKERNPKQAEST
jgi:hypothetical protein